MIIWSFPLYCYAMPSHLKALLDRTIPLVKMNMVQEEDGTVRHEELADFSRIHTLVICGCGFPDWDGNFDGLRMMCRVCFGNPDIVCVPETPLLNIPEAAPVAEPLLDRFEKAGVKAVGRVCIGTVQGDLHDIGKNLVKMMLEGKGLHMTRRTFPGGHDWGVWRRCIHDFLPMLFR